MNPAKSIKKSGKYLKKVIGIDWIYTVAIRKRTDVSLFEGNLAPFAPMPYSTKYWYADPFLIDDQSGTYLFAEAFDRDQQVGRISVSTVSNEGEIGEPRVVLSEPYHLSFPMVFTWKDHYYMVPETSENNSINLYMASQFPYDWQMVKSWQVGKSLWTPF